VFCHWLTANYNTHEKAGGLSHRVWRRGTCVASMAYALGHCSRKTQRCLRTQPAAILRYTPVFVLRDIYLWLFDSKINGFSGLMGSWRNISMSSSVICIGFWDIVRRQTDRQTDKHRWKYYHRGCRRRGLLLQQLLLLKGHFTLWIKTLYRTLSVFTTTFWRNFEFV